MRLLLTILGLIGAILAIVLCILPLEQIAIIPGIIAIMSSLLALYLAKNEGKKLIKFTLAITVIAIVLIAYKMLFASESEVTIDENFIEQSEKSEEKAIEELEDLEELNNFEDSDSIN